MIDSLVVSNYLGAVAVGGLNIVMPVQRLIVALAVMISLGAQTHFAKSLGQRELHQAVGVFHRGEKMIMVGFTPLFIILFFLRKPLFQLMGAGIEVGPLAHEYLAFILPGMLFMSLTIYRAQQLIAMGQGHVALYSTLIGAGLNIILDLIFVRICHMGVAGAGLSTSISQFAGWIYVMFISHQAFDKWQLQDIKPNYSIKSWQLIILGLSSFVIEAEDGILIAVFNRLLANTVGDHGIIILGLNMRLYLLLFIALCAMAAAMQPLASYHQGGHNYKKVLKIRHLTQKLATLGSLVLWGIFMIFTPTLLRFFIQDELIIQEAAHAFRIMIAGFPLISMYYVSIYYFQALGKGRLSFIIAIFRQLLLMVPLSLFMVKVMDLGVMGIWLSYPISDVISGMASLWLLRKEDERMMEKIAEPIATPLKPKERIVDKYA